MFDKLHTAEDNHPKNMWRKAFQKKMPNRAEIRFTTKTIVTSLSRDIYPDSPKSKIMIKFSLSVIHVSPCVMCHNGFTILSIRDSKVEGVRIKILARATLNISN